MTQSEFMKIKTSGRIVGFARQIKLRKSGIIPPNDFLQDFCQQMHPTGCVKPLSESVAVYSKTTYYYYTLYRSSIVRIKQPAGFSFSGVEFKEYTLPENLCQ